MTGTNEKPGVNVRALKDLFRIMRERSEYEYSIKVSMLEIYNERIFDLLTDDILEDGAEGEDGATGAGGGGKSKKFEIRHTPSGQVHIPGLTEIPATSLQHVIKLLAKGSANRTVAATKMNLTSSRSHSVLQVIVTGHNRLSKETMNGKLTLVDLAGSERVSRSEATGARLVEAAAINKSLSTLGQVFTSLRNKALHVPYRNSKLTYLLQDSLGGDSKTALFMNVSPLNLDAVETSATLMFGLGVRAVELGPAKKHVEKTTKK
jgi:kinesin family protein C2/C3